MKTSVILIVIGIGCVCGSQARGNNNSFLPGDAYFSARLTERDLERLKIDSKNGPMFEYSRLSGHGGYFCGYAGYCNARFTKVDQAFIDNLKRAYRHVRRNYEEKKLIESERDGKKVVEETNGVGVLFYPEEFEFPKYRLGLPYNENWMEEVEQFGHKPRQMILDCPVDTADGVMECWRDARAVAGLKAELPKVELKPLPPTTEPIVVRGAVKAFVVDSRPLSKYFDPKDGITDNVSVLCVDSNGITEISYSENDWKSDEVLK